MKMARVQEKIRETEEEIEAAAVRGEQRHTAVDCRLDALEADVARILDHLKLDKKPDKKG